MWMTANTANEAGGGGHFKNFGYFHYVNPVCIITYLTLTQKCDSKSKRNFVSEHKKNMRDNCKGT